MDGDGFSVSMLNYRAGLEIGFVMSCRFIQFLVTHEKMSKARSPVLSRFDVYPWGLEGVLHAVRKNHGWNPTIVLIHPEASCIQAHSDPGCLVCLVFLAAKTLVNSMT